MAHHFIKEIDSMDFTPQDIRESIIDSVGEFNGLCSAESIACEEAQSLFMRGEDCCAGTLRQTARTIGAKITEQESNLEDLYPKCEDQEKPEPTPSDLLALMPEPKYQYGDRVTKSIGEEYKILFVYIGGPGHPDEGEWCYSIEDTDGKIMLGACCEKFLNPLKLDKPAESDA